jgi:glutamate-1-semialdehyde 2,1-aminomutase
MVKNLDEQLLEQYCQTTPRSKFHSQSATNYFPGGVTRTLSYFQPYPAYIDRGEGCKIIDVDGNERIDFFNNATSLILGHAHPAVVKAVQERVALGTAFHAPTPLEIELAGMICERVRSVEKLRFTNSGTEACMFALRAAKVFTGKKKIGKFEGGYHGTSEYVSVSVHPDLSKAGPADSPLSVPEAADISENILKEVIVMPFNNIEAVERIVKREKRDLACIIVEPMMGSAGIIPAKKGFLGDLRKITQENEILLIFDEVQTFRHSWGGAQELCGVIPDLTTFAKIIGGGFPVGALGGKREIMDVFDSSSGKARLPHGGTFNGNPVTMAAGVATLRQLTPEVYLKLNDLAEELRKSIASLMQRYKYRGSVTGETSFFKIHFSENEICDYRSALIAVNKKEQSKLFFHFLNNGIFLESQIRGNLSVPMRGKEIHCLLNVFEDYLKKYS